MIETKIEWFEYKKVTPADLWELLFYCYDGGVHSGYFYEGKFVEPCDDGEVLRWNPDSVHLWAYIPRAFDLRIPANCEWRPYHKDYTEPYNNQEVLFVDPTFTEYPQTFAGYYNQPAHLFIDYAHDFRFDAATVLYWMPLPKPPEED